ncbi:MAG: hypothetical protein JKY62_05445 [Desulfocapsa sp.]|nr:hypothetical protein [Desulfocapsa sp.]MBN4052860.1 hypothetical protein [bacterium AH-315-K15]MBN4063941.1 hypothetical protein [bacterium AH-315-I07]
MQNHNAYKSVIRARTSLLLNHPFFASLALRLTVQEDTSCQTAWTDGNVFAYNPDYINILSQAKLEGLAAHLVMHPACNHHKRRQSREPKMWNRACDYAINGILLDAGFTLPDAYLYLEEYRGRSAESVPLQNPTALKEGQALIVQLYFDGKPMPYKEARVTMSSDTGIEHQELTYLPSSEPFEVTIGPPGTQLINAKFKLPVEGKKVVWYAFTLTFNTTK